MEKLQCSIIIPVFNAEKTIEKSLNNIINNKSKDFALEIIVVNDGSFDKTLEILDKYKEYDFIKVINKENGGVSSARNVGLDNAVGKYIAFSDADDILFVLELEKIVYMLENNNVDLGIADYVEVSVEKKEYYHSINLPKNKVLGEDSIIELLHNIVIGKTDSLANLWNKVFKKKVINSYHLRFDEKRTHGEDCEFCTRYLDISNNIMCFSNVLYKYVLDNTQCWDKYSKGLGYGLIKTYNDECKLSKKYKFLRDDEKIARIGLFLDNVRKFITLKSINNKEIKKFIKNSTVKKCLMRAIWFSNKKLQLCSYSRRDKIWMVYLRLGLYKKAIKFMTGKRSI